MLTRLKVNGFKNLVAVDIRFGPFTCIAGANGVGKSNLFDAIRFLSTLADGRSLIEAAQSVRGKGGRLSDIRNLFHHSGDQPAPEMSFEADMIVPETGKDDAGQEAVTSTTFLRYHLVLAFRKQQPERANGYLEILKEELTRISRAEEKTALLFPVSDEWRESAIKRKRSFINLISTDDTGGNRVIKLHHETIPGASGGGRPISRQTANLPRTVLSQANAVENRTALLAKCEMQSWRLLQLEPSSLRQPDEFMAKTQLDSDGSHIAATLYALANDKRRSGLDDEAQVYGQVANRLSSLIDDIREIMVDRDENRELLTIHVTGRDGTVLPARSLSDGTLRFLALAVLNIDPAAQGVICLEEPENGIHPGRITAMIELLRSIATNVDYSVGSDNPLRQVIINTHSPSVVQLIPDESLIIAELKQRKENGKFFNSVRFSCLSDTWRSNAPEQPAMAARGTLIAYLDPTAPQRNEEPITTNGNVDIEKRRQVRRVMNRPELQMLLPFSNES